MTGARILTVLTWSAAFILATIPGFVVALLPLLDAK